MKTIGRVFGFPDQYRAMKPDCILSDESYATRHDILAIVSELGYCSSTPQKRMRVQW